MQHQQATLCLLLLLLAKAALAATHTGLNIHVISRNIDRVAAAELSADQLIVTIADSGAIPGQESHEYQSSLGLWKWLAEGGARMSFAPGYSASGVRGGLATTDIPAGGELLSIPMRMTFRFPANWTNYVAVGEQLAVEAAKADSPYQVYFGSMPTLENPNYTLNWESFPSEYMHLIQAQQLSDRIIAMQAATQHYWARHGPRLRPLGVSLKSLRAAMVTVSTRWYQGPTEGPYAGQMALIPGYDLLNHRNGCPIQYTFEPCASPQLKGETCCVVRSGVTYRKGDEVCNSYHHLTPDVALFQYGFLLPEVEAAAAAAEAAEGAARTMPGADGMNVAEESPAAAAATAGMPEKGRSAGSQRVKTGGDGAPAGQLPSLSIVDVRGVTAADLRHALAIAPPRFSGTPAELEAEQERLQGTLSALLDFQEAAERTLPAPSDPDGAVLTMVLSWRRQRIQALDAEVARLQRAVKEAGQALAAQAAGKKKKKKRRQVGTAGAKGVAAAKTEL